MQISDIVAGAIVVFGLLLARERQAMRRKRRAKIVRELRGMKMEMGMEAEIDKRIAKKEEGRKEAGQ